MKLSTRTALTLSLGLRAGAALADPPVKVCVAVGGDPDEAVRAAAETVADVVSRHASLRGVADADARAALRGEGQAPADFADLATARRALRGEDADAATLDAVANRLGCGLVLTLSARPAGTLVRVYDPVRHAWAAPRTVAAVDAALVDAAVLPALAQRNAPDSSDASAPADASVPADGGSPADAGARAQTPSAPRAAATQPAPAPSTWSRVWPWLAVGGVVLAVVGAYFLVGDDLGSNSTRVTVSHQGAP